jgi:branched-subunit amino acid transport protein
MWLLIALMTLVTYLPRYLPMGLAGRIHLPPSLERALEFVPVAVLTAIIAQSAFVRDGQYDFSPGNFHAIAALTAFVVALITRRLFVTILAGLGCFVLLRLAFGG